MSPLIDKFNDIGFSSRNYVSAMGSLFLFMNIWIVTQGTAKVLRPFRKYRILNRFRLYLKQPGFLRSSIIRFLLEGYIEFFIASLLNWENVTEAPKTGLSWEWTGLFSTNYTFSDIYAAYLGHLFTLSCLFFPLAIAYILASQHNCGETDLHQEIYDMKYDCLYDGVRLTSRWYS
mmetsp:Transcript_5879/g.9511  ORF Transcript_5879/g.9511 Transcript_5879/m.9511 type:complete len:175 (-) Transcript_5879:2578-3102(-)